MNDLLLTQQELRDFIGYAQPSRQIRWLEANGFRRARDFYINAEGKVRLPREVVAHRGAPAKKEKSEPDFSKVRQTRGRAK